MTLEQIFSELNPKYIDTRQQWRMTCPFRELHDVNSDGSNSFFVSPEINAYHCFSCKSHGNLIQLLTVYFKVPLMQAYEYVNLSNLEHLLDESGRKKVELDESAIIPLAPAEPYLKRGFGIRLQRFFEISGEGDHVYTPIFANDGSKIVAYKHRIGRNFWYTPEGFDKENYLFNIHRVSGKFKTCILVEGETDVLQSCNNGIWNVVCQSGGELSDTQVKLLLDFDEIILALDNDIAGTQYTEIAFKKLSPYLPVKIMMYNADDPGKCKKEEWVKAYNSPLEFAEYTFLMSMEMGESYIKLTEKINHHGTRKQKRLR